MFSGIQQMTHLQVDDTLRPLDYLDGVFSNELGPVKVLAEIIGRKPATFEASITATQVLIQGGVIHNDYLPAKQFPIRHGRLYLVTQADFPVNGANRRQPGPSKVTHSYVWVDLLEEAPQVGISWEEKEIYSYHLATVRKPTPEEKRLGAGTYLLDPSTGRGGWSVETIPVLGLFYLPAINS
jgi:hypothetical protein